MSIMTVYKVRLSLSVNEDSHIDGDIVYIDRILKAKMIKK